MLSSLQLNGLSPFGQATGTEVVVGLTLIPVSWILYKFLFYPLYLSPLSKIPGPPVSAIPFTGNFWDIFSSEAGYHQLNWSYKFPRMYVYHGLFNIPRVLLTDPDLIREVLVTNAYDYIKPPNVIKFLGKIVGEGLLIAEGSAHKHQRKHIQPSFNPSVLRSFVPSFFLHSAELVNLWKVDLIGEDKAEVNILDGCSRATLDIIGTAGFGYAFHAIEDDEDAEGEESPTLHWAYKTLLGPRSMLEQLLLTFLPFFRNLPLKRNFAHQKGLNVIRDTSRELVEKAKESRAAQETTEVDDGVLGPKDLLTVLVEQNDKGGLTDEELVGQVMTFLVAGHETTSVTLTWSLYQLALDPDIQDKLRAEITPLFSKIDFNSPDFPNVPNLPTYEEMNALPYLNNFCKEILRLIPPVPSTTRVPAKDVVLNGYFIPKGTPMFFSPVVTHRHTHFWGDDVMDFRPERWDEAPAKDISPYTYFREYLEHSMSSQQRLIPSPAFLAGPRQCIGNRFALMELKVLLCTVLYAYKFHEKPGYVVRKAQGVTWRPKPGMRLIIERAQ
ncbi:hypothetical protein BZG36_03273 [Bifiguratus adelaidae]|uniref:Cytochrome P450 n=1 Tax=Bifiguratus adelaidae TaxID=1938954 RepID=A0A261XZX2_9FUNG|nr:hypothetical protein BZG36_03273 [Bifiguratus adelaidae]